MGKSLDKDKPHGEIHGVMPAGDGEGRFVQDGQMFDIKGDHVGPHDGEKQKPAPKTPAA